jgi:TDG/mug DNA glycosylase family protein
MARTPIDLRTRTHAGALERLRGGHAHRRQYRDHVGAPIILPDYIDHGLDVVFCGTAAGNTSAARKHYFSDPGNPFWTILHETGFTTERLTSERDRQVLAYCLGLTDLVKSHSGIDADLHEDMYDISGFEKTILKFKPRYVAFTSKQAAADYYGHGKTKIVSYGLQDRMIGATRLFVLPSTSGSARRYWDEAHWRALALLITDAPRACKKCSGSARRAATGAGSKAAPRHDRRRG